MKKSANSVTQKMGYGIKSYTSLGLFLMAAIASATPIDWSTSIDSLSSNVSPSPVVPTHAMSRMVSSPLIQKEVDQFLECVRTTKVAYKVDVDNLGYIVVGPSSNRTMDLNVQDAELLSCMTEVADFLKTAAGSSASVGPNSHNGTTKSIANVNYEWLKAKGAEGHKRENATMTPTKVAIAARAANTQYFNFYRDHDKGCHSEDLLHSTLGHCHTYMSSWASQQIENISGSQKLRVSIWPHHDCSKGNSKTYVVPHNSVTHCIDRTTYSYYGKYES